MLQSGLVVRHKHSGITKPVSMLAIHANVLPFLLVMLSFRCTSCSPTQRARERVLLRGCSNRHHRTSFPANSGVSQVCIFKCENSIYLVFSCSLSAAFFSFNSYGSVCLSLIPAAENPKTFSQAPLAHMCPLPYGPPAGNKIQKSKNTSGKNLTHFHEYEYV